MPSGASIRRLVLTTMCAAALSACAARGDVSTTLRPSPFPGGVAGPPAPIAAPRILRVDDVVATALAQRGVAYRLGGTTPSAGFDCSGFVRYVFGQHAVDVPRTAGEQYRAGSTVSRSNLRPGDLVFFTTIAPGASHVGLVVGPDQFVHAPASNGVVRVESLSSSYWSRRFVGARRLLSE